MTKKTPVGIEASYGLGFVVSLLLTLAAYLSVSRGLFSGRTLVVVVMVLAVTQLVVQLLFFLHMDEEARPRWRARLFIFAVMVVLILGLGSLWIMTNLDYRMMTPQQMIEYMNARNDKAF